LVIWVGTGMRGPTGWMKDCFSTVIRPPEVAAISRNRLYTHSVAAPIPRTGSVWDERVCLVPNPTSVWIELWMLSALMSLTISRVSVGTLPCSSPFAGLVANAIVATPTRAPAASTANAA
jgi:hypothetical protein